MATDMNLADWAETERVTHPRNVRLANIFLVVEQGFDVKNVINLDIPATWLNSPDHMRDAIDMLTTHAKKTFYPE